MDIKKVELNLGHKTANPFKTTRKSNTNPFKYNDFEGNTIDPLICADVLVSFKGKENKLKMISSSVMGSMTKLHRSLTEPIINFVNKVKSAWEYASHTNITDIAGIKNIKNGIYNIKEYGINISNHISGLGDKISEKMSFLGKDITDIGHDLKDKWNALISNVNHSKIQEGLSVAEYRDLWIKENELLAKEIALNPETTTKAKVA